MQEPTLRIMAKATVGQNARRIDPPRYLCQCPGCGETSSTIACPRHLAMLPLNIQSALTRAIATGEAGVYGPAMKEAMLTWTEEPS
jgi:hypothetical protein